MDNIDFCDSSGSDIVEEEMPHGCKQQVNNKNLKECGKKADKRLRSDNEEIIEDEEGFITVRKDKKRLLRRPSMSSNCSENNESTFKSTNEKIIVCVTSKEVLPKPFGMAKLLRSENIKNILKIQYKNPYKILIQFEDRKDAECLIKCSKFQSLDYRCQFIEEINLSYGVVKQIDLDIEEKEILESIESEKEVVSAKRLRRQSESGEWIQSETIRICFKSSALPPYLLIYGCRFKVEPYTFPVSQCSGCWRFGHLIKSCPTKKLLCPKCGGNHSNCETITFRCINCKGPHMSMNKSCPMFKKEKAIRKIMCEEHCTYRRALTIYLNKSNSHQTKSQFNLEDTVTQTLQAPQISPQSVNCDKEKSYRDVLLSQVDNHTNQRNSTPENHFFSEASRGIIMKELAVKSKKVINNSRQEKAEVYEAGQSTNNNVSTEGEQTSSSFRNIFYLKKLMDKLNEIVFSKSSIAAKIKLVISVILEEIVEFVLGLVKEGDLMKKLFSLFNNG